MILHTTPLAGVYELELQRVADERGYFARTYSAAQFAAWGLKPTIAQCSTSFNLRAGTLRGLHYQDDPHGEAKLVRCTRGEVHDVVLDLRRDSDSYLSWCAATLSEDNGRALFIPPGCAHGFQTLRDRSEVFYQISVPYEPASARGVRWDDPVFAIDWPAPPGGQRILSARDASYPDHES